MLPCIVTPGGTEGGRQRVLLKGDTLLSTAISDPPVSCLPPFTSPAVLSEDITSNPQSTGKCTTTATGEGAPSGWEFPSCTRGTSTTNPEGNDGKLGTSPLFRHFNPVCEKRSTTATHGSVVHGKHYRSDSNAIHPNYGTRAAAMQPDHNDKNTLSIKAQVKEEASFRDRNELLGFPLPGRRADGSCWRDGLSFFSGRENYTADEASNASATAISEAENEEAVQPRNFFPFNSIFAVAGWGSGAGWLFSSGGAFEPATNGPSEVGAESAGDSTAEQGAADMYITRCATVPRPLKVLPPLLSIGKRAAPQKTTSKDQGHLEQHGTPLENPVAKQLLASPWHRQEGRHDAQARMSLRRKRVDMSPRGLVSGRVAGLQMSSITTSRHFQERSTINNRFYSISKLTKSVGDVLWSYFCKLMRSRFNSISTSAGAATVASKAAKRFRRIPGLSQLFREDIIGLALQDFSVGEVVRQWLSSLLHLSGRQAHGKSVFLGPVRARRSSPEAAETAEYPKKRFTGQNRVAFPASSDSGAHVFITPEAGRLLWRSACSLIANPVTAMYFQCYRLASLGTIVYVTSVVHWWQPQLGIRRTVDVLTVCIVSGIHIIVACVNVAPPVLLVYLLLCCTGVACYLLGCSLAFQGFHQEAAICHIGLHSLCTIGNVLLYYTISL